MHVHCDKYTDQAIMTVVRQAACLTLSAVELIRALANSGSSGAGTSSAHPWSISFLLKRPRNFRGDLYRINSLGGIVGSVYKNYITKCKKKLGKKV
jgi:hypothetical protein